MKKDDTVNIRAIYFYEKTQVLFGLGEDNVIYKYDFDKEEWYN